MAGPRRTTTSTPSSITEALRAAGPAVATAGAGLALGLAIGGELNRPGLENFRQFQGNNGPGFIPRLQFPENLGNYRMQFQFSKYYRPSIFRSGSHHLQAAISLPIPANLVNSQSVEYAEESLPMVAGVVGDALGGGGPPSGADAAAAIGGAGVGIASRLATAAVNGATLGSARAGLQMFGLSTNPFLTVMFRSPRYKRHEFAWRLSPNNLQESNILKRIIDIFQYSMLPDASAITGGAILTYPDIVHIKLLPKEDYLYVFKPCVIENMAIDYVPNKIPAFYGSSNAPAEVELRLSVLEIEYWIKSHIDPGSGRVNPNNRARLIE